MAYLGAGITRFNTADDLTVTDDAEIGGDLTVTGSADINGGTIDGASLGASSAITSLTVDGNVSVDGGTIKLDGNYPVAARNVALGDGALDDGSLSGNNNTAVGADALTDNTSGASNTATGKFALQSNTTADNNTAIGNNAMQDNTTGSNNTAVGMQALTENTSGANNVAMGFQTLLQNTTASDNTAVGYLAGNSNTTGAGLAYFGANAGQNTTGTLNTFIGQQAGVGVTTGAKNTILGRYNGNQGGLDIRTSSNNIVLSDGDGNPRGYYGVQGSGAKGWRFQGDLASGGYTGCAEAVQIKSNREFNRDFGLMITSVTDVNNPFAIRFLDSTNGGVVGSISHSTTTTSYNTSSDYRLKENVVDITDAIDRVKQLKPSQFNFIIDPDNTVDGFLAHEVQEVVPEAINGEKDALDDEGNPEYQSIDQAKLVPLLTAALKEAITEIETLKERVTALENQ